MASPANSDASQAQGAKNSQVLDQETGEQLPLAVYAGLGVPGCECCGGQGCEIRADDVRLLPCTGGCHPCLDVIRFVCVFLVVADHACTVFGVWNLLYVQAWVLQYLYIICGISFAMSSNNFLWYELRLGMYLAVGVGLNWLAFVAKGLDWKQNYFDVVFQFWFIVGLALFLLVLWPLKVYLVQVSAREYSNRRLPVSGVLARVVLIVMVYILLKVVYDMVFVPAAQQLLSSYVAAASSRLVSGARYWGLPQDVDEARIFVGDILTYLELSVTNLFIIVMIPSLFHNVANVLWYVILNTYAHRCIQYRAAEARIIDCFDLTMMGLVAYYFGLGHRRVVGEYMVRYMFVFLLCCLLMCSLSLHARLDEHSSANLGLRVGDSSLEMMLVVLFFTSCERLVDPKIFTKEKLQFLNTWTLVLFFEYKAVHILVPPPFNLAVLIGSGIVCYLSTWRIRSRA